MRSLNMESVIAIGIVLIAAVSVAYGLYRDATGKSGCDDCHGCGQSQETCKQRQTK
jgi:hypothetical protein